LFSNKIENLIAGVFPLPSLEYLYVESYSSSTCSISFPELRSPCPAVGKRELWEHPFQACAIDTIDADCAMRSETGCAEFGYFLCCFKMDAPRALVFRPLVKGNEALGTRLARELLFGSGSDFHFKMIAT